MLVIGNIGRVVCDDCLGSTLPCLKVGNLRLRTRSPRIERIYLCLVVRNDRLGGTFPSLKVGNLRLRTRSPRNSASTLILLSAMIG